MIHRSALRVSVAIGLISSWTAIGLVACGDEPPSTTAPDGGTEGSTLDGPSNVDGPDPARVTGQVHEWVDESPVPGAKLFIVDAKGVAQNTVSDGAGVFTFSGVETPYAIRVEAPDPAKGWEAFDHVTIRSVVVGASNKPNPEQGWASHKVTGTCAFLIPACAGNQACSVDVTAWANRNSTDSFATGGVTGSFYGDVFTYPVDISWIGTSSTRNVTLDAIHFHEPNKTYYHASIPLTVEDGKAFACGANALVAVPNVGTVTPTTTMNNVPSAFTRSFDVVLTYASGGSSSPIRGDGTAPPFPVPDMSLKGFSLSQYANDWANDTGMASAFTPLLPVPTTTLSLTLYGPPTVTLPPNGTLARSESLKWLDGAGATLYLWDIVRENDGGSQWVGGRIYTDLTELPLSRFEKLGVVLTPGAYRGQLSARRPAVSIDSRLAGPKIGSYYADASGQARANVKFTLTQ